VRCLDDLQYPAVRYLARRVSGRKSTSFSSKMSASSLLFYPLLHALAGSDELGSSRQVLQVPRATPLTFECVFLSPRSFFPFLDNIPSDFSHSPSKQRN
jgi:hypothetical protein